MRVCRPNGVLGIGKDQDDLDLRQLALCPGGDLMFGSVVLSYRELTLTVGPRGR